MRTLLVFIAQSLLASAPLVLAALGGVVSERAGVATIALEAYLLGGAFASVVAALASGSTVAGLLASVAMGALLGGLFAGCTVGLRAQSIVTGVAVNLFAAAGTRVAIKVLYDSASNTPSLPLRVDAGSSLALAALRDAFTSAPVLLAPLLAVAVHAMFARTVFGLRVTACGEHPEAAASQGVRVRRVRSGALVLGGAIAALGGAQLGLHQGQFLAYMSGGRGFLALAAVILGRWEPLRAAGWALAIGSLSALEATLAGSSAIPPAVLQALPFAVTLMAVALRYGRARAPAALG